MKLVVQISRIDVIFMGYCMEGQLSTMVSSVMYNSKFNMEGGREGGVFIRFPMMPCKSFLRDHLRNFSIIDLFVSDGGRVGGLVDSL